MSTRSFAEVDNNSPTNCFQRLCQVMLDGGSPDLTKKNIEDFRVILHMIMHECSKANIETGKVWVFEHCRSPAQAAVLMEYMLSLSSFRKGQEERIHMIYLVNDILFHTARRQLPWMRDAMLPLLTPLLMLAYEAAESAEYKAKVMKVISFWGDQNIFEASVINNIRQGVSGQLPYDQYNRTQPNYQEPSAPVYQQQLPQQIPFHHQQQYPPAAPYQVPPFQQQQQPPFQQQQQPPFQQQYSSFNQPPPQQQRPPIPPAIIQQQYQGPPPTPPAMLPLASPKQYFDLPAGLMVFAKNEDYKPIDPAIMKFTFPHPSPSNDIVAAVDDFYKELDLSNEDDSILDEKVESKLDAQGWEKGYLDAYFDSLTQKKKGKKSEARRSSRGRSRSRDAYTRDDRSYGRRRSRSRSPMHRSNRHRSYSRSRSPRRGSPPRRSSPPRSGSPPRRRNSPPRGRSPMGRRSSPLGRGRSPHSRRSPPGRGRSPPRRSPPHEGYRQRRNSRSRSPPAWPSQSYGHGRKKNFDTAAPKNKYLGLGNASDEFDSFRRNKSQAYNRREPHQPITCYKCNKIGHLARECNSL